MEAMILNWVQAIDVEIWNFYLLKDIQSPLNFFVYCKPNDVYFTYLKLRCSDPQFTARSQKCLVEPGAVLQYGSSAGILYNVHCVVYSVHSCVNLCRMLCYIQGFGEMSYRQCVIYTCSEWNTLSLVTQMDSVLVNFKEPPHKKGCKTWIHMEWK